MLQRYLALQEKHYALKEICIEQERTLEELGGQLSAAKLAAVELREAADNAQHHQQQQQQQQQEGAATWANDRLVTQCKSCNREFNITRRKVIKLFNCPIRLPPRLDRLFRSALARPRCPRRRTEIGLAERPAPGALNRSIILCHPENYRPRPVQISHRLHTACSNRHARTFRQTKLTESRGFIAVVGLRLFLPSKIRIACTNWRTLMHDSSVIRDNTLYRAVLRLAITSGPDPRLFLARALPSFLPAFHNRRIIEEISPWIFD